MFNIVKTYGKFSRLVYEKVLASCGLNAVFLGYKYTELKDVIKSLMILERSIPDYGWEHSATINGHRIIYHGDEFVIYKG